MMWMFEYIYAVLDFDLFMIIIIQCFCATVVEAVTFMISVVRVFPEWCSVDSESIKIGHSRVGVG